MSEQKRCGDPMPLASRNCGSIWPHGMQLPVQCDPMAGHPHPGALCHNSCPQHAVSHAFWCMTYRVEVAGQVCRHTNKGLQNDRQSTQHFGGPAGMRIACMTLLGQSRFIRGEMHHRQVEKSRWSLGVADRERCTSSRARGPACWGPLQKRSRGRGGGRRTP